ncbi:MAG: glycoside hydrolase family 28 protein [Muribaculaceae bacterium]|nr:glycoside hydrolase family 28 protein [Muribaculaceae bacterium]
MNWKITDRMSIRGYLTAIAVMICSWGCGAVIPDIDSVGAALCPEEIAPIGEAPFAMADLARPVFPDRVIDISKAGAKQGRLCTKTIQRAIDRLSASGGGTVLVPAGQWLTGRIILKDNINLRLAKGSTLRFSDKIDDYLPVVFTRNEGVELMSLGAMIYANGARNIAVTGDGTLMGCGQTDESEIWREQGKNNPAIEQRVDWRKPVFERIYDGATDSTRIHLPMFFAPINCSNVLVEGVIFKNAIYWNITPTYCDSVIIRGVTVDSEGGRTDGIDIDSSSNVLIEYCTISSGDDNYTLKAGRCEDGVRVNRPTENVVIRHCLSLKGPGGLTIGTETAGMVRNVWCHDCVMDAPSNGFYLKSRRTRGGGCENITAERIRMKNVKSVLTIDQLGNPAWIGLLAERRPVPETTPLTPVCRNITMRDVEAEHSVNAITIKGLGETPVEGVRIERWKVRYQNPMRIFDVGDLIISESDFTHIPNEL